MIRQVINISHNPTHPQARTILFICCALWHRTELSKVHSLIHESHHRACKSHGVYDKLGINHFSSLLKVLMGTIRKWSTSIMQHFSLVLLALQSLCWGHFRSTLAVNTCCVFMVNSRRPRRIPTKACSYFENKEGQTFKFGNVGDLFRECSCGSNAGNYHWVKQFFPISLDAASSHRSVSPTKVSSYSVSES